LNQDNIKWQINDHTEIKKVDGIIIKWMNFTEKTPKTNDLIEESMKFL
jgi:hypothetical protein